MSETVVFELPARAAGESLCERLQARWFVALYECGEIVLVALELRSEENDLAVLLRAVKLWAVDSAIPALHFHLDGREYMLEGGSIIGAAAA